MEAALRLKVESLTQELSGYTTRLQALNDARTAVEASEARTASQLKSAQQGLRKYEATIERLTIENGKLTDRLRTEVQAASIKSAQRERDAAQLSQHAQAAEAHADATSKSLAASQEATRQALADLAEATATTVQLRDENAAQRVNLEKTEMMLRKQTRERENLALEAAQLRQNMSMLQDSVPSQVAALSDARTAAETQALKLRQEMATMKQALSDQNTKFDKLAEQHGENERRRVSDRKAWSAARARMEG
jgi:chromosome segregation ATPase